MCVLRLSRDDSLQKLNFKIQCTVGMFLTDLDQPLSIIYTGELTVDIVAIAGDM
jgi:hypothetical protein